MSEEVRELIGECEGRSDAVVDGYGEIRLRSFEAHVVERTAKVTSLFSRLTLAISTDKTGIVLAPGVDDEGLIAVVGEIRAPIRA